MSLLSLLRLSLLTGVLAVLGSGCVVEPVYARPMHHCPGGMWMEGHYGRYGRWHPGHWRCPGVVEVVEVE